MPNLLGAAKLILPVSIMVLPSCFAQTCTNSSSLGSPDRVSLRNGDALTGRVLSIGADSVGFCSPALGLISIPRKAILQIESSDGIDALSATDASRPRVTEFSCTPHTRLEQRPEFENTQLQSSPAELAGQKLVSPHNDGVSAPAIPKPQGKPAGPKLRWFFEINAPASIAFGTTSQETYGGQLDVEVYEGKLNHSKLWSGGTYNRSWQVGSQSIFTDTFDGYFQQSRSLGAQRGGLYGKMEWFLNTALGMALQDSFGAGYYSPKKKAGAFEFNWLADLRYFRERLYKTTASLELVGSRLEGQLTYRKKDPADPNKTKYSVISRSWISPMWNNENTLQAFTTLQISVPLGRSICLNFNPIEDDYMRNAPMGNKKNYLTSSVTLQVKRSFDPKQGCY